VQSLTVKSTTGTVTASKEEQGHRRTGLLVGARRTAIAPERGSPLSAEARVQLDHRAAAPVPAEPRVEVQYPRRRVPVAFTAQLHRKLRHASGASTAPRRADQRDVWPQRQPAGQGQQDAAAASMAEAEIRARPRDRGRAPRRAADTHGRGRGGWRAGGGEDVAEEAPAGPEGARGGRVQQRGRGGGVERAHVEGGDGQPMLLVQGRRSGLLRRVRAGKEAVGGV